ncbi:MAG: MFS transporter, partial [Wolinella sp.]
MKEINALLLTNILYVSAMMAFLSVVGPIIRALGMAEWHAGVTVAIAGIVWIFLSRYWGKKSDKIGRKPVLLIGVAGFTLFYFALSFYIDFALLSPQSVWLSLAVLILTRGLIGAFYSAIQPASTALIADKIAPALRASYIAKIGAASGLGMVIGP